MEIRKTTLPVGELTEYILQEQKVSSPATGPQISRKNLTLGDYERLYSGEKLVELAGVRYPMSVEGIFENFDEFDVRFLGERYAVPEKFRKFSDGMKKAKVSPGSFDGRCINVREFSQSEVENRLVLQEVGYFDFMSTTLSQDVYLRQFDDSFLEGQTLRDFEVRNGKTVPLTESNLGNVFAEGFLIYNPLEDSFLIDRKPKKVVVQAGSVGILGGTPEWNDGFLTGQTSLSRGMVEHIDEEMLEELCLTPSEYRLGKIFWVNHFERAPAVLTRIDTEVPSSELAKRCVVNKEALKEHASLITFPANIKNLEFLAKESSGYQLNNPSCAGLKMFLDNI